MRKILTAALAALTLGGAAAAIATTADARDHDGWRDHGGWHDHDGWRDHDRGRGRDWDDRGGVRFFFAPPPAYFTGADYYSYYGGCHSHWRWNGYWHRYVRVNACY